MRKLMLISVLLFTLSVAGVIYADDFYVPDDYLTIQAAITAASAGDRVIVSPGDYPENVTMKNMVDLIGSGADVTTIDGRNLGNTISTSGVTALIEGFKVINGNTYGVSLWSSSHVTLQKCIIRDNNRGIGMSGGSNTIVNNVITHNPHWAIADGSGNHLIVNNCIQYNATGYYVGNGPYPTLTNNIIVRNGVGIDQTHSGVATLHNNDVWGNDTDYLGLLPGPTDIFEDPEQMDPESGDFHLKEGSPCIDEGTPIGAPPDDFDGNPRDAIPDIGAFEFLDLSGVPPSQGIPSSWGRVKAEFRQ